MSLVRLQRHLLQNVVGYVALFIALGGSSYAVVTLSKGSVKAKHIAKNAVNSTKVKDRSLLVKDFKPGQLKYTQGQPGLQGPPELQGPQGDTGPQGEKGEPGAAGEPGTMGISAIKMGLKSANATGSENVKSATALCPAGGYKAISGGNIISSNTKAYLDSVSVINSYRSNESLNTPEGWYVLASEKNEIPDNWNLTVFVYCAKVGQ